MRMGLWRHGGRISFTRCRPHVSGKIRIGLFVVVFLSVISLMLTYFENCVRPNLTLIAKSETALFANKVINDAVSDVLKQYEGNGGFSAFTKDNNGTIASYHTDMIRLNEFASAVSEIIYQDISDMKESTIYIPLGSVLCKHAVFSRLGPKLKVRIKPLGFANIQFKSHFTSEGINEVKHEVILDIRLEMVAYIPGATTKVKVSSTAPIDQTIVMGKVPDTYTNFEGSDTQTEDKFLDITKQK